MITNQSRKLNLPCDFDFCNLSSTASCPSRVLVLSKYKSSAVLNPSRRNIGIKRPRCRRERRAENVSVLSVRDVEDEATAGVELDKRVTDGSDEASAPEVPVDLCVKGWLEDPPTSGDGDGKYVCSCSSISSSGCGGYQGAIVIVSASGFLVNIPLIGYGVFPRTLRPCCCFPLPFPFVVFLLFDGQLAGGDDEF